MQVIRALWIALLLAGCSTQTGIVLHVEAPADPTSIAQGVASLELLTSHRSYCERWIEDTTGSRVTVDVKARDLARSPFELLIKPTHFTDLDDPVELVALARDANGTVIAAAWFGAHYFSLHTVEKYSATLEYLDAADVPVATQDGCVCADGHRWLGTGSQTGCDALVVTSFPRLVDTAGCELPAGGNGPAQLAGPVCDGQHYGDNEAMDRVMPCFGATMTGCAVGTRTCHDDDGLAWQDGCAPDDTALVLPSPKLCDVYKTCNQPCADVVGCVLHNVPPAGTVECVLHIDPSTPDGTPIQKCQGQTWDASLDLGGTPLQGAACVSTVIQGVEQPPFTLGLVDPMQTGPQPVSARCPPILTVDSIDAMNPAAVPDVKELDVTIGDQVVHVRITVARSCEGGSGLICRRG